MSDTPSRLDRSSPEAFLNDLFDSSFKPQIQAAQTLETWVITGNHYPTWKKFLPLFDEGVYDKSHKDYSNGYLHYKTDMAYPEDLDPTLDFHRFIKICCAELPIKIGNFKKAWGVDYKPGAYSGLHCHAPGKQLTAVLFLTNTKTSEEYPLAGYLTTLQPLEYSTNYLQHVPKAGDCVIMDGRVYHGTYPTLNQRKVFVCDFDYETLVC